MPRTYTHLHYHLVFSTKGRLPWITPGIRDDLYRVIGGITADAGAVLNAIGGVADHVHLLVGLKPTLAVARYVQQVKGASSKWLNESGRLDGHFFWQGGYGAFSVSASQMATVHRYVLNQEEHHRDLSFNGEMRRLLRKHGLEPAEDDFND